MDNQENQLLGVIEDMITQKKFTQVLDILGTFSKVQNTKEMLYVKGGCLAGTRNLIEMYDWVENVLKLVSSPDNVLLGMILDMTLACGHVDFMKNIVTNYIHGIYTLSTCNMLVSIWFGLEINVPFLNLSYGTTEDSMGIVILMLNYLIKKGLNVPFKLDLHKFTKYSTITSKCILQRISHDYLELNLNHPGFNSLAKLKLIQSMRENSNPATYDKVKNYLLKKTTTPKKKYMTLAYLCSETVPVDKRFDWIIKCYDFLARNASKNVANIVMKYTPENLYEEEKKLEIQILLKQQLGEYDDARKLLDNKLFESKAIMVSLLLAKIDLLGDTRDVNYSDEVYLKALLDGLDRYETLREIKRRLGIYYTCHPECFHEKKALKSMFSIDLMVNHHFNDLLYKLGRSFELRSSPCFYSALYIYLLILTCKFQGELDMRRSIVNSIRKLCLTIPRWIDKIMKAYSDDYVKLAILRAIGLVDEIQAKANLERCPYEDLLKPLDVDLNLLAQYNMISDKDAYYKLDLTRLSRYLKNISRNL